MHAVCTSRSPRGRQKTRPPFPPSCSATSQPHPRRSTSSSSRPLQRQYGKNLVQCTLPSALYPATTLLTRPAALTAAAHYPAITASPIPPASPASLSRPLLTATGYSHLQAEAGPRHLRVPLHLHHRRHPDRRRQGLHRRRHQLHRRVLQGRPDRQGRRRGCHWRPEPAADLLRLRSRQVAQQPPGRRRHRRCCCHHRGGGRPASRD